MRFPLLAILLALPPFVLAEGNPVDRLTPTQVGEAIEKIRSGGKLDAVELDRARLQGLLLRQGEAARLISTKTPDAAVPKEIFHAEMLPRSVNYLRLGDLNEENVRALAASLAKPTAPAGVILDLRATRQGGSYELAARVINLFSPRGAPYFQMSGGSSPGKTFAGTAEPVFTGMIVVLVNADCGGPAETIAASLRQRAKALLAGTATAGRALEYLSFPMGGDLVLQVAVAKVVLADGKDLSKGLQPDLTVAVDLAKEREVLAAAAQEGVAKYLFEVERPHMNEASLVAGRNPEIDLYQARQARGNAPETEPLLDRTLQRALDTVTTVLIYRAPKAVDK